MTDQPTTDVTVLREAVASIDLLFAEVRRGLHDGTASLRQQMTLMEQVAEQFDLAGKHDAACDLRRRLDSLVSLRRMEDDREAADTARAERRRKWRRILTLGFD